MNYEGIRVTGGTDFNTFSTVLNTTTGNAGGTTTPKGEAALTAAAANNDATSRLSTEPGASMTNACWTVVAPYNDGTNTFRAQFAGYTGSPHHCVDTAIDGFTVMGVPMMYKIGKDIGPTVIKEDNDASNV